MITQRLLALFIVSLWRQSINCTKSVSRWDNTRFIIRALWCGLHSDLTPRKRFEWPLWPGGGFAAKLKASIQYWALFYDSGTKHTVAMGAGRLTSPSDSVFCLWEHRTLDSCQTQRTVRKGRLRLTVVRQCLIVWIGPLSNALAVFSAHTFPCRTILNYTLHSSVNTESTAKLKT